jgi:hypothetical protein
MSSTLWTLETLSQIGGHVPQVLGAPKLVETPGGPALAFDGRQDGLVIDCHPLAGAGRFTAEMVFRPEPGGEREQRVLHLQEVGSDSRVLIETRAPAEAYWFLDTFVKSGDTSCTLYAETYPHPFGPWYHVALVHDGQLMRHYVSGKLELSGWLAYAPQPAGRTSIGVRLNRVSWFRGLVRAVAFTPLDLSPEAFRLRV